MALELMADGPRDDLRDRVAADIAIADKAIIERNQQGVNSRYYVPGPLSTMENYTWKFLSWYLQTMQGKLRVAA